MITVSNFSRGKAIENGSFFRSCKKRKVELNLIGNLEKRKILDPVLNTVSGGILVESSTHSLNDQQVKISSPPIDDEQYLEKALRAAMLKCRFAETISKASGDKAYPRKVQQERDRLQRIKREKDAEEELKKKAELRRQLEKQREVARIALEMVERTVEIDDNLKFMKELEKLSQCHLSYSPLGYGFKVVLRELDSGRVFNPLDQLGLCIKEEFLADVSEEPFLSCEREEGEKMDPFLSCKRQEDELLDTFCSCEKEDGEIIDPILSCERKERENLDQFLSCEKEEGEILDPFSSCGGEEGEVLDPFLSHKREKVETLDPSLIHKREDNKIVDPILSGEIEKKEILDPLNCEREEGEIVG